MKTNLIHVVCCIVIIVVSSVFAVDFNVPEFIKKSAEPVYDEIYYLWEGETWEKKSTTSYQYDQFGNSIERTHRSVNDGVWVNANKVIWEYNELKQLVVEAYLLWFDDHWDYDEKKIFTYDENGNLSQEIESQLRDGTWSDLSKLLYKYDEINNLVERIYQREQDGELINHERVSYHYNEEKLLINRHKERWDGENWYPRSKNEYTYESGLLDQNISHVYGTNSNEWFVQSRQKFTYDQWGNLIEEALQWPLPDDDWFYHNRHVYEYDENHYLMKEIEQDYKEGWVNRQQYIYFNNVNGSPIEMIRSVWKSENWELYSKRTYSYEKPTFISEHKADKSISLNVDIYPNPFNPSTNISFMLRQPGRVSVEIYNINGKKVKTLISNKMMNNGDHEQLWDGINDSGMPVASGVYICKIRMNNESDIKRITLLR